MTQSTNKWKQKKTPELLAQAKKLEADGLSFREIGRQLGISKGTVRLWLHPECQTKEYKTKSNRIRQDRRNHKYKTDPLYRIKQLLRVAEAKARRCGYCSCITPPEEILKAYSGKCDCCFRTEDECGVLCIDHWHDEPAIFRAWLCNDCNRALGMLGDNPVVLRRAADLLEQSRRQNDIQKV